jgi:iron(III) transport system ATP-binding protein
MAHLSWGRSRSAPADRNGTAVHGGTDVTVEGLIVRYAQHAVLNRVDLEVPAGGILALLGPSGCGKTTLLRSIAGLVEPSDGTITLGDRTVVGPGVFVAPERRQVGMVFQDWALFPHLSVARNVGFGLSREARRAGDVHRALDLVGLVDYADRLPATLSGGQQQRVALARALATRPSVLLLDEPFSNLDAALRTQLRREVTDLLRAVGTTTIFVTHDQEEAFLLGDEVALMLDGAVRQQGVPADLYEVPLTRDVAGFVGDANLLRGTARGATADTMVGRLPLRAPCTGDVSVLVRPEHLRVSAGSDLEVERVEYYGHDAVYVLRAGAGQQVRVRILERPLFERGDLVAVRYTGGPTVAYPVPAHQA